VGVLSAVAAIAALSAFGAGAAQAAPPLDYQATPDNVALTPVNTGTATHIWGTGTDDGIDAYTSPFPITLYDTTSSTLSVSPNGYVGLGGGTGDFSDFSVDDAFGTPVLAPFASDLYTGSDGGVFAETRGSSPHRTLVLEWDVETAGGSGATATGRFQAIFTEGSLRVQTQYARTLLAGTLGGIATVRDIDTHSSFGGDGDNPAPYPADATGLDITPTGLTATTDAWSTDGHPTISGEALDPDADVTVRLYAGTDTTAIPLMTDVVTPEAVTGAFAVSYASPVHLPEGDYTVQATQTDLGHEHTSVAQRFTVDETAPAPTLTMAPTGRVGPDPFFQGATSAGDNDENGTLDIYAGGTATGEPIDTVDFGLNGPFSAMLQSPLDDGTYTARVDQPDAAGNIGHSVTATFTVDGTAPNPFFPRSTPRTGATPTFTGIGGTDTGDDAHVTLAVYAGTDTGATALQQFVAPIDGDGNFTGTAATLPDGDYTVTVTQSDDIDNGGGGDSYPFTVDTVAPAPTLTAPANGASFAGGLPTFSGTAGTAEGDGTALWVAIWAGTDMNADPVAVIDPAVGEDGRWSGTPVVALPAGTYTARVSQLDDVGNEGDGTIVTFTIPAPVVTPPPAAPVVAPAPVVVPVPAPAVCHSTRVVRKSIKLPSGRKITVTATLDGKKAKVTLGKKAATVTVDLRGKAKGTHVLRVTTKRTITVTKTKNHHKVKSSKTVTTTAKTSYKVCL
jgi:hypothetical protein